MNTVVNRESIRSIWGFSCYLWGWDDLGNPAFAVLYGGNYNYYDSSDRNSIGHCVVFRGENKHFPSFDDVVFVFERGKKNRMYNVKDVDWGYANNDAIPIPPESHYNLKATNNAIKLDLNKEYSYADIIEKLKVDFKNFRLATSPSEVLQLPAELAQYEEKIIALFTKTNIYTRKKIMTELVQSNAPKELFDYFLNVGSEELISGLFLELAKQQNPILEKEARELLANASNSNEDKGIPRCVGIYLASICNEKAQEKISHSQDVLLEYKKSIQEGFRYISLDRENVINVKSAVQLAEVLKNGNILGGIAYCIDVEKHMLQYDDDKPIVYLKRYLRRILDNWANTNETQFIQALKVVYTSYRAVDWKQDFTVSSLFFIKQYLFPELSSIDEPRWDKKNKRGEKKNYVLRPDIWDRHLDIVVDIACETQLSLIASSMVHILKFSDANKTYTKNLPIEKLITLAESSHSDVAKLGIKYLAKRLKESTEFDYDTVTLLLNSRNEDVLKLAMEYLKSFGESLSPQILVALIFVHDVFEIAFNGLDTNDYIEFVKLLFSNANKFTQSATPELVELLDDSIIKLESASMEQKTSLVQHIVSELINKLGLPQFVINYAEKIIFSLPETELNQIVQTLNLSVISDYRSVLIFTVLRTIKDNNVPELELIVSVLENGFSSTLNTFVQILTNHKNQLTIPHWVLLFESSVFALNELAKNEFITMENAEEKFALHSRLLDSPDEKTYRFGIQQLETIYVGEIPPKFLLEMLEHTAVEVRAYASGKVKQIIESLENLSSENNLMNRKELFVRYAKTLLFLPNKAATSKKNIYALLPKFVELYKETQTEVEAMLLELGASNVKSDSEQALVTLAKIKAGVAV